MERLDFQMPPFVKHSWTTQQAKDVWESRFEKIRKALAVLEVQSVIYGNRNACRIDVLPDQMPRIVRELATQNIMTIPIRCVTSTNGYASEYQNFNPDSWSYSLIAFSKNFDIDCSLLDDSRYIGKILGYPNCCIEFFIRVWENDKNRDTTNHMTKDLDENIISNYSPHCNILWRWLYLRTVFHLPCSFNCEGTTNIGTKNISLGYELGYNKEMNWLQDILTWPVEWSSLHGIAEIKTPVIRICCNSDATGTKHLVRLKGTKYPEEGVNGITFPYRYNTKNILSKGTSFRSFDTPEIKQEWYYKDNGFSSLSSQTNAHSNIIRLAQTAKPREVLDLGCGNGSLLLELSEQIDNEIIPFGCDANNDAIAHAKLSLIHI